MVQLSLKNNNGFRWYTHHKTYVKGYAFDAQNNYLSGKDLALRFAQTQNTEQFEQLLRELNGFFAVVHQLPDKTFFAVDHVRSIPLFFKHNNGLEIYDQLDAKTLKQTVQIGSVQYFEAILSGTVVDKDTLLPQYKQLLAGRFATYDHQSNELKIHTYYTHLRGNFLQISEQEHYKNLQKVTENFFDRLINSLNGRTALIPLSGGYDSRYILAGLKIYGYPNIMAFTYGRPGSFEVSIGQKVAHQLGIKHFVVEYNDQQWSELFNDPIFHDYLNYGFNYVSSPHIQDFMAVKYLKAQQLIPEDSVLIPGYCGDTLGGTNVPKEFLIGREHTLLKIGLPRYAFKKLFYMAENLPNAEQIENQIVERIANQLGNPQISDLDTFVSYVEHFATEHRLAKFIINGVRVYEYFDYQWRMPLWDKELIEYWFRVPYRFKIGSQLYNQFLFKYLFEPLKIDFKKPVKPSFHPVVLKIRKILPDFIHDQIQTLYKTLTRQSKLYDVNRFKALSDILLENSPATQIKFTHNAGVLVYFMMHNLEKYFKSEK